MLRNSRSIAGMARRVKSVPSVEKNVFRFDARDPDNSCRLRLSGVQSRCLGALSAALLMLYTFGCATPHATLQFTAPSAVTSGAPFTVTVTVLYQGKPDTVINSRIHFTSSDPAAVLPPDYYYTPSDAGSHTWPNGFILMTPGNQTISGEIIEATGINGSAAITVSP
jgi:hypothetical protein